MLMKMHFCRMYQTETCLLHLFHTLKRKQIARQDVHIGPFQTVFLSVSWNGQSGGDVRRDAESTKALGGEASILNVQVNGEAH